jgi:PAS domain S-box-containing protein
LKSGDRIEHFETVRVTKTGKRINVSLTISPIKDSTGRTVGISGIARDITERKLAEEALRASEERLRLAQQAARIGTFDWNIRTGVNTWTPELEAMYGLPPGGFGGTQTVFENLVHPDDRAGVIKLVDAAMKTGQPTTGEWRVVWGDRSVHWIAGRWQVFRDASGEPSKMIGVNIDITERKRAEEALRESEEWLHLAVQAGRMYAFEWDATTDVIVRSGECADILNWIDDPTRDTGREFAARVHPDDREAYTAPEMVLTPGNPTYKTSYRVLRPDGSAIWLEANGHVFFDDQGRLQRIIGMVADVTGRKLAEEALFRLSRRLIEAQELERARIARELHDDLSQRMALLQISLEQVAQDTAGLSSKIRQQLHNITKVSAEISSSLHDLSHQLHPYKLDTLGLVAALGGFCNEFSRQHNLQVQFVHHHVPAQIPNEVTLCLFRIAQEALRNVVKHSGGTEAEVELSGHGDRIDLCISDSGVGFSPEHVKAETGLGLISIRERLRLVGGHLSVESEPSHGTRIRARVPLFTIKSEVTGDGKAHKAGA